MSKLNRSCCVCGTKYEYCPSCGRDLNKPSWMNSFHSENCKNVYEACAGYSGNALTKDEAKKLLDLCDLSDKQHYTPATQKLITEIYTVDDVRDTIIEELNKDTIIKQNIKSQFKKKK